MFNLSVKALKDCEKIWSKDKAMQLCLLDCRLERLKRRLYLTKPRVTTFTLYTLLFDLPESARLPTVKKRVAFNDSNKHISVLLMALAIPRTSPQLG